MAPFVAREQADSSARRPYDLIVEPSGRDYLRLLEAALGQCSHGILLVPGTLGERGRGVVTQLLALESAGMGTGDSLSLVNFPITRESVSLLQGAVRGLFGWRAPERPESLSLWRSDGSPWLVSVAHEHIAYMELTSFERLLLSRIASGVAAALAPQGAHASVLSAFEKCLETAVSAMTEAMEQYCRALVAESREGILEALLEWLESGEQPRQSAALDIISRMHFFEMKPALEQLRIRVQEGVQKVPPVYRNNQVLAERWKARLVGQLSRVILEMDSYRT